MDISLHYSEAGTGFPLILLHGNNGNLHYFEGQIPIFAREYRVLAVDTRGHGESPRGDGAFTISRFADDLLDFFREHGIRKAHLLGFSDGANIALIFALRHPEMVEKLILNGGNLTPRGIRYRTQLPIEAEYRRRKRQEYGGAASASTEMLGLMVLEPKLKPKHLKRLSVPTLVIAGVHDMVKAAETRRMARALPCSELVIQKGDHFIAQKHPEPFNRAVLDFLQKRKG